MPINRQKTDALGLLLLAIAATPLASGENATEAHDNIRAAAEQHVLDNIDDLPGRIEVKVGSLDSRLRLAECDRALETYDSPNALSGGRGVVGVRCEGSKPWKLYVPVQIAVIDEVVVTRRSVVRGETLQADDLMLSEMDTSRLRKAYFTRIEDAVGLRSKRSIASGSVLHAGLLKRVKLVKRGSKVEIIANLEGLDVRMRGEALADGGRGDRIRVKNLSSGRVVTGTVTDSGVVHVLN
jgi:flagella basal body P-ring formation protein FlgA